MPELISRPTPSSSYRRPGRDVVIRIVDDRRHGAPDGFLAVGIPEHAAAYWRDHWRPGQLWTAQRWDQDRGRWRRLSSSEAAKFDAACRAAPVA